MKASESKNKKLQSRFSSSYFCLCGDPNIHLLLKWGALYLVKCFLYNMPAQKVEIGSLQKAFFPIGDWLFVKLHISVVHLFSSEKASRIAWISSSSLYLKHDVKMFRITFLFLVKGHVFVVYLFPVEKIFNLKTEQQVSQTQTTWFRGACILHKEIAFPSYPKSI